MNVLSSILYVYTFLAITIITIIIIKLPNWLFRLKAEAELWELRDKTYEYEKNGTIPSQNASVKKFIKNIEIHAEMIPNLSIGNLIAQKFILEKLRIDDRTILANKCNRENTFIEKNFYIREAYEISKCIEERNKIILNSVRYGSWLGILMQIYPPYTTRLVEQLTPYWIERKKREKELLPELIY